MPRVTKRSCCGRLRGRCRERRTPVRCPFAHHVEGRSKIMKRLWIALTAPVALASGVLLAHCSSSSSPSNDAGVDAAKKDAGHSSSSKPSSGGSSSISGSSSSAGGSSSTSAVKDAGHDAPPFHFDLGRGVRPHRRRVRLRPWARRLRRRVVPTEEDGRRSGRGVLLRGRAQRVGYLHPAVRRRDVRRDRGRCAGHRKLQRDARLPSEPESAACTSTRSPPRSSA